MEKILERIESRLERVEEQNEILREELHGIQSSLYEKLSDIQRNQEELAAVISHIISKSSSVVGEDESEEDEEEMAEDESEEEFRVEEHFGHSGHTGGPILMEKAIELSDPQHKEQHLPIVEAVVVGVQPRFSEGRYKCDFCPAGYSNRGSLSVHVRSKHLGQKWGCHVCDALFTQKRNLDRHLTNQHGVDPLQKKEENYKKRRGKLFWDGWLYFLWSMKGDKEKCV